MRQKWTAQEDESLRESWARGDRAAIIGKWLGRSKNAVIARANRLGLEARVSPIIGLRRQGAISEPSRSNAPKAEAEDRPAKRAHRHDQRGVMDKSDFGGAAMLSQVRSHAPAELGDVPEYRRPVPSKTCQWIVGKPTKDDGCKCGKPSRSDSPYCETHHERAYIKRQPKVSEAA